MKISEPVRALLHAQIGHELSASSWYLSAAAYFADQQLDGWSAFFVKQSEEERSHAMKIAAFLMEVGAPFTVPAIPEARPMDIASPLDACEKALKSEQHVTAQFREMFRVATAEGDYIALQFLPWFINEQIEEENSMERLGKIVSSGINLFQAEALLQHDTEGGQGEAAAE